MDGLACGGFSGGFKRKPELYLMHQEVRRQLIHLSGVLFILMAQFTGRAVAVAYFFLIAFTFLLYSFHVKSVEKRWEHFVHKVEAKLRDVTLGFERPHSMPFQGAFWFYIGCGLAFALFPLQVATAATIMLAVGDAFSTLVGVHVGKTRLLENKTLEGTVACFATAFIAGSFFIAPSIAFAGAVAAAAGELLPGLGKRRWYIDDNWIMPLLSGVVMLALSLNPA